MGTRKMWVAIASASLLALGLVSMNRELLRRRLGLDGLDESSTNEAIEAFVSKYADDFPAMGPYWKQYLQTEREIEARQKANPDIINIRQDSQKQNRRIIMVENLWLIYARKMLQRMTVDSTPYANLADNIKYREAKITDLGGTPWQS